MSLRDVERAMIILEYFYEKMHLFAPLMNQKAEAEMEEFTVRKCCTLYIAMHVYCYNFCLCVSNIVCHYISDCLFIAMNRLSWLW